MESAQLKSEKKTAPDSAVCEKLIALKRLIETLRGENGCPWDRKQTPKSMSVFLIEEMYELVDAIANGGADAVREELGDVLFHILFVAAVFQERREFDLADVLGGITEKMVRRHPHVFGEASVETAEDVKKQWHKIKSQEKEARREVSILDSIPKSMPALTRAYRISERAVRAGFDWSDMEGALEKAEEELGRIQARSESRRLQGRKPPEKVHRVRRCPLHPGQCGAFCGRSPGDRPGRIHEQVRKTFQIHGKAGFRTKSDHRIGVAKRNGPDVGDCQEKIFGMIRSGEFPWRKSKKPTAALIAAILLVIACAGGAVWFIRRSMGLSVAATFPDAKGVSPCDPVKYKGIRIGAVEKVQVDLSANATITMTIDREHAEHVRQHALFTISTDIGTGHPPGILLGYCKDENPYKSPLLVSGAVVRGEDSQLAFMFKTNVGCFRSDRKNLAEKFEDLAREFQDAWKSPKMRRFYDDIEKFVLDLNKKAREGAQKLQEEKAPEIRKKIEGLIRELERLGREKEADQWKKFLDEDLRQKT